MKYSISANGIVLLLFFVSGASAQSAKVNNLFGRNRIEVFAQNGFVFPTDNFVKGVNIEKEKINHYQAYSARYVIQTDGNREWERFYNYPIWGAGVYVADFFEKEQVGIPIAGYLFFSGPFKRWDRLSFNYGLAFGMAFNWKAFNAESNAYNQALGASQSVYIDAGMDLRYQSKSRLDYGLGFSISHFSNGALKKPNEGLNTIAPKLTVAYCLDDRSIPINRRPLEPIEKEHEWLVSAYSGVTNIIFDSVAVAIEEKYRGSYFPIVGLSVLRNWQVSRKSKIGLGLSYAYNGSTNAKVAVEDGELEPVEAPFLEKTELSLNTSYELVVNKTSLVIQPSFYLYRKQFKNQIPAFHQLIGLKYQFTEHLFAAIKLRAHNFSVSDFIVWQVGWRL